MLSSNSITKRETLKAVKEMPIFQLLQELFKYEKMPSTTPPEILQELLQRLAPSYMLQGLECVRGEGAILKAQSRIINPETREQKEYAVKILRPHLNLSLYQKISKSCNSKEFENRLLAVRKFKERFEAGVEIQKYIHKEIEREKIDYFAVPKVNFNSDVPCLFLEMEWVQGINILRWLKDENDVKYSIGKFCTLLDCVQFCHDRNVIHRDLKAENIMVGGRTRKEEKVYLLDWTTSKPIQDDRRTLTLPGEGLGTPGYSEFEQLEGGQAKNADVRSDIYSLGLVLFEFWHNQFLPRLQDDEYADLEKRRSYLDALGKKMPEILGRIFQKATCIDRNYRYQSCAEFKTDIVKAIEKIVVLDKGKRITLEELTEEMQKYEDSFSRRETEIPGVETIIDTSTNVEEISKLVKDPDNLEMVEALYKIFVVTGTKFR